MGWEYERLTGKDLLRFQQSGYLGHYRLIDWWMSEFTNEERRRFEEQYKTMGWTYNEMISGEHSPSSSFIDPSSRILIPYQKSATWFLTALVGSNKHGLGLRILKKAEECLPSATINDVHTLYMEFIQIYKKEQETDKTIRYCKKSIDLAPFAKEALSIEYPDFDEVKVRHLGFDTYSRILYKEGNFKECLEISLQAKEQGWKGDWDKFITRINKHI